MKSGEPVGTIRALWKGRTVFLSSHLLDEVERTCDMVAIVDQGRVVRQGPIAEIPAATLERSQSNATTRLRQWRCSRSAAAWRP